MRSARASSTRRRAAEQIAALAKRLSDRVALFSGVWVENKGLALTVRFRGASPGAAPALESQVRAVLDPLADQLRSVPGPMATEITPRLGWTKGTAARTILRQLGGERGIR